jgi:hypothetical protein
MKAEFSTLVKNVLQPCKEASVGWCIRCELRCLGSGALSIRLDENFAPAISEGFRRNYDIMLRGAYAGLCSDVLLSRASSTVGFVCVAVCDAGGFGWVWHPSWSAGADGALGGRHVVQQWKCSFKMYGCKGNRMELCKKRWTVRALYYTSFPLDSVSDTI